MSNLTDDNCPNNTADAEDLASSLRQMFDLDADAGPETDEVTVTVDGGRAVADAGSGDWAAYDTDGDIIAEGESGGAVELGRHIRRVFGLS